MIHFSALQMHSFQRTSRNRFVERLVPRMAEHWQEEYELLRAEKTALLVRECVDAALSAGFSSEMDVARYVHLVFAFRSAKFHEQPWAAQVLADTIDLQPRLRMNRLFEAGCEQLEAPT